MLVSSKLFWTLSISLSGRCQYFVFVRSLFRMCMFTEPQTWGAYYNRRRVPELRRCKTAFKATAFTPVSIRNTDRLALQNSAPGCGSRAVQQSFEQCPWMWISSRAAKLSGVRCEWVLWQSKCRTDVVYGETLAWEAGGAGGGPAPAGLGPRRARPGQGLGRAGSAKCICLVQAVQGKCKTITNACQCVSLCCRVSPNSTQRLFRGYSEVN